jgi:hypothetical protein
MFSILSHEINANQSNIEIPHWQSSILPWMQGVGNLYTLLMVMYISATTMEISMEAPQKKTKKLKIDLPYVPAIILLDI